MVWKKSMPSRATGRFTRLIRMQQRAGRAAAAILYLTNYISPIHPMPARPVSVLAMTVLLLTLRVGVGVVAFLGLLLM